jgi:hypothetical protein
MSYQIDMLVPVKLTLTLELPTIASGSQTIEKVCERPDEWQCARRTTGAKVIERPDEWQSARR